MLLHKLQKQTPDCFSLMVVNFLDPSELHMLCCVSKDLNSSITKQIKSNCVKTIVDRFKRAVRMPDGAIRIFTRFGKRSFDMYTVPNSFITCAFTGDAKTPRLVLKNDKNVALVGSMACVADTFYAHMPTHLDIFQRGNDAVLSDADEILITDVQEVKMDVCGVEFTWIKTKMRFNGVEPMLFVRYLFLRTYTPRIH